MFYAAVRNSGAHVPCHTGAAEDPDGALGESGVALVAQELVGNRIEEISDLDMKVNAHSSDRLLAIFIVPLWKLLHRRPFDRVKQPLPAHADMTHDAAVQLRQDPGDCGVALGEGKELEVA